MRIGFVGLGHMGNPMALNLVKAGYTVNVYDVVPAAVRNLVRQGGAAASSLADVTREADVIITMLQTGDQVQTVCLGQDGLFANAKPGTLYIDSSSIEITVTQRLHEAAKTYGIAMLDAPVSGGVLGAKAATLAIMVGGSVENFTRALPLFEKMGKKIVHAGEGGLGQAAKICNNLILGISMIAVSEGFSLAEKLGLDAKKFFEISSNASGQCWAMTSYCPVAGIVEKAPSNYNYQPGFKAKMMLKDLQLAEQAANSVGASIPMATVTAKLYSLFVNQGHGEMDFSGIIHLLRQHKILI